MNSCEMALYCRRLSLSIIPIKRGTKIPTGKWGEFKNRIMTEAEIERNFPEDTNIALVCGEVSEKLECIDFDEPEVFKPFMDTLKSVDPELHSKLVVIQETPSGGYHFLYRCSAPVDSSKKLAMGPKYLDGNGKPKQDTLIETKTEGGYFAIYPSKAVPKQSTPEHPLPPKPYTLRGRLEDIPIITPEARDLIHGIARSFDGSGREQPQQGPQQGDRAGQATGDRVGDRFNRETNFRELLEGYGCTYVKTINGREHYTRPGKTDGSTSLTVHPELGAFCFSTSTPLPTNQSLRPFAVLAYYEFDGDFFAAAQHLRNVYDSDNSDNSDNYDKFRGSSTEIRQNSDNPAKRKELSREVRAYIEMEPAPFTNNDVYSELCAKTRGEKKTISDALQYYKKQGKINSIDGKRGHWEVVEDEPETMNLLEVEIEPYNISLPLGISEYATVRPGSIILLSGASNAGKTVFLLSTCRNYLPTHTPTPFLLKIKGVPPLFYLNSEMSAVELATRIKGFGDDPASWMPHVKFIERTHSFDKLVDPDGVTFVDYLEVNEDFFNAGKFIADIHRRLKGGVAVVAMQKKQGAAHAKGGEMTLEKPRLVINLDRNEQHGLICKIMKAKEPVDYMHSIQGMERDFVITGQSGILPISDWRFVTESQRKKINQEYDKNGLPDRVKKDCVDYQTGELLALLEDPELEAL